MIKPDEGRPVRAEGAATTKRVGRDGPTLGATLEITAYLVFGPADTTLEEMARIAGRRGAIEESFAQSKSEVGLDQHEVRSRVGWHRHMTLAMTAQALRATTRARLFAKPAASERALAAFKKSRGLAAVGVAG